jgi:hypothetical protein
MPGEGGLCAPSLLCFLIKLQKIVVAFGLEDWLDVRDDPLSLRRLEPPQILLDNLDLRALSFKSALSRSFKHKTVSWAGP